MRKIRLLKNRPGLEKNQIIFVDDEPDCDGDYYFVEDGLEFYCFKNTEGVTWEFVTEELPSTSQPDNNPKTSVGGMNKMPLHLVPITGIVEEALSFADGGFKYGPFNFAEEPISASVYAGALFRHFALWYYGGQSRAGDSNAHHLGAVRACANMVLDAESRGTLNDNRPPPVDVDALFKKLEAFIPELRERDTTKFDLHDIPEFDHSSEGKHEISL